LQVRTNQSMQIMPSLISSLSISHSLWVFTSVIVVRAPTTTRLIAQICLFVVSTLIKMANYFTVLLDQLYSALFL